MAEAWIFQDDKQVKKHGADKASWYVGWFNLEGKKRCKSCGPGARGKDKAEKLRRQTEGQLEAGTYAEARKVMFDAFRKQYEETILCRLAPRSRDEALTALAHFERIVKPGRVSSLSSMHVDNYVAERRKEPGKKQGSVVSPATVNKEMRHLKAALRQAREWKYLDRVPKFRMEKIPKKLASYMTGDHFAAIYGKCDTAKMPENIPGIDPADWWRGLLVFAYMTGWRSCEILALRRDDVDLDAGYAVTRAEDNKGDRDDRIKLHPVVVEHLKKLPSFDSFIFPWNHDRRTLDVQFHRIQAAAAIHLPCHGKHEHTAACHFYGFHDLRRAFATMNADKLTADALQTLMRHKSYQTTQIYINMTRQMDAAVASLHVPNILQEKKA